MPSLASPPSPRTSRLQGTLSVPSLSSALMSLVERHQVLRTNFECRGLRLTQRVLDLDDGYMLPLKMHHLEVRPRAAIRRVVVCLCVCVCACSCVCACTCVCVCVCVCACVCVHHQEVCAGDDGYSRCIT